MRIKNEKEFQAIFSRFIRSGAGREWMHSLARASGMTADAAAFELKVAHVWRKGVAGLRFKQVEEHQQLALARACGEGARPLVHKISDSGIGQKPFDCFVMADAGAYVVVAYVRAADGQSWAAYAIPWPSWSRMMDDAGGRGSVDESTASRVGIAVPLTG